MFSYNKILQYPIRIRNKNPQLASLIATQYGGAYTGNLEFGIKQYFLAEY